VCNIGLMKNYLKLNNIIIVLLFICWELNAQMAVPTFQAFSYVGTESGSQTFSYTGAEQTFTVPSGVNSITVDIKGAGGGYVSSSGSKGGRVQATLPVTAGETLYIYVGGSGIRGNAGGFNGGGSVGGGNSSNYNSGGGASDIRSGGNALSNRIAVAGGGGGNGGNCGADSAPGGDGGGLVGESGCENSCSNCQYTGAGGTQSAGGVAGPTSNNYCTGNNDGTLGNGGSNTGSGPGGFRGTGGGGGYYGGGSGCYEGAGGGSSYTAGNASSVTHTQGYQSGNGEIVINW